MNNFVLSVLAVVDGWGEWKRRAWNESGQGKYNGSGTGV